ncbi:MAG TPA: hypothetical protein VFO34_09560 [Candidatus Acidoferrales bacterium]|nr:hypothetical protein [Candidatus Acidoferrales bacterium]
MHCTEFELTFGDAGRAGLPAAAAQHLSECAACRNLAADIDIIRSAARELAIEPQAAPARVWTNLRAQLRAEGIIREQAPVSSGWDSVLAWLKRPYVAGAYAAMALLAIAVTWQPSNGIEATESASLAGTQMSATQRNLDAMEKAFTSGAAQSTSIVDIALRKNLSVVDNFIAVCEKAVKQEPHNEIARQYLYGAYQQKAELLNTAMEHSLTGEE